MSQNPSSNHFSCCPQAVQYSADRLCELLRDEDDWVTRRWLAELLEYGVLVPDCGHGQRFSETQLERARNAARIQRELQVAPPGIALALELRKQIISLESRVADLELKVCSADTGLTYRVH